MTLGLIHTVQLTLDIMKRACLEIIPEVKRINLLDEGILSLMQRDVVQRRRVERRLQDHIRSLEDYGAEVILNVCSVLSDMMDGKRVRANVPLLRIDEPMIREAVKIGGRIGIIANNDDSARTAMNQMEAYAATSGARVEYVTVVEPKALAAREHGNVDEHDRLIAKKIEQIDGTVDVVVLSQASLSFALEKVDVSVCHAPILSSPRLAVEECKKHLVRENRGQQ